MDRITDAFAWPVRDREWVVKVLVIGLLLLVPVAGVMNGIGWMLASLDRLRSGEEHLPPANFTYVGRGARLFVVELVYALALAVIWALIFSPAVAILSREGNGPLNAGLASAGVLLNVVSYGFLTLATVVLNFALPSIILATERGGVRGGLQVRDVVSRARTSLTNTVMAGLMLVAAGFVGSLGFLICCVGLLFTTAYSLAMQAWIVRCFEVGPDAAPVA